MVNAALATRESMFCSDVMTEIGFRVNFSSVPLYIDNTVTLHVIDKRTYSARTEHVALRSFFIRELVKEGKIPIHYEPTDQQLADIGTKHLNKQRHRFIINLITNFGV